jgi:protein-tyrosine phosphatase
MPTLVEEAPALSRASEPANHRTLLLPLDGCHNFRAVSGWRTRDGRQVIDGRLYRSDGLDRLSDADTAHLAKLGILHVLDLRASGEMLRAPSRWPQSMDLQIWAGAESAAEANILAIMQQETVDANAIRAAMCQVYARFPDDLLDAVTVLAAAILAQGVRSTLVHCTAGKDRTGFVVAMLLHAIGVHADDVMADYLLSNASFASALKRFNADGRLDAIEARAPGATAALVKVEPDYLGAAERTIIARHGSIVAWLEECAGLSRERRDRLAACLLD